MTVEVEILDPRHDPEPAALADFITEQALPPFWSYDLLAVASWNSCQPVQLALIRADSELVGAVCAVWMPLRRKNRRFTPSQCDRWPGILAVRQPFNGYEVSWRFRPDVPDCDRARLLAAFERVAMRRLGPTCLGVAYLYAQAADLPTLYRRRPVRRLVRRSGGIAVMDVRWPNLDGWLGSLTPSRRQDLRRQRRRLSEDPDLVVRVDFGRRDLDTVAAARLLRRHHVRYFGTLRRMQPTPLYLDRFVTRPDVGVVSYCDTAGRLLAMGTLVDVSRSRAIIGQWAALRPEEGGRQHLYFDMYARALEWAIATGRRTVTAGTGMLDVKQSLGFRVEPTFTVIAPRWIA